jgi:uncharacterized membrane protein
MNESPLTQKAIDAVTAPSEVTRGGLISKAVSHPFLAGSMVLVGAGLAYAAVKAIKNANGEEVARDVHVETSIMIDKSPEQLYSFWRDFKNLPLFMKHLESVTSMDDGRTHWVAKGIGGINQSKVEWDAEIYNEIENEMIAWRSVDNADVVNAGSVRFQTAPQGHGTYVRVTLNYNPPAGSLGASLSHLLGAEPGQVIKEELRRFKQLMEAGEIATVDGQSSGRAENAVLLTASINHENETGGTSNGE